MQVALTHLRASLRLVGILTVTAGAVLLLLIVSLLLAPWRPWWRVAIERVLDGTVALGCLLTGVRIDVRGQAPEPPFVLVSNHLGYMDILVIRRVVRTRFVSKAEISRWPLFGWLASLTGTVFLERRNKRDLSRINRVLQDVWDQGDGITLFPEGTSSAGKTVKRFHAGLLDLPAETGRPVHSASLAYRTSEGQPAAWSVCWWGDMTFLDHLYNLLRMRRFDATVTFSGRGVANSSRKELAADLHEEVLRTFQPIDGAPAE